MDHRSQDDWRVDAIEAVARAAAELAELDREVCLGAGRRDVWSRIAMINNSLRTLKDAVQRDGRWAHWQRPR